MKPITLQKYNSMCGVLAHNYGVSDVTTTFTAIEPIQQSLNDAIQEKAEFLKRIQIIGVEDKSGNPLIMRLPSSIAGRTNTAGAGERSAQQAQSPDGDEYECVQVDYDLAFPFTLLDTWARYKNFRERYTNACRHRMALDRITIGFNGTHVAADSDRETYPLLQDVNIGWLQLLKTKKPSQFMLEGATAGKIKIGAAGDYANVDTFVHDLLSMIPRKDRSGSEVVIIGEDLVSFDTNKIYDSFSQTPSEKIHFHVLEKTYGGLPAVMVPFFPARGVLITDLENLMFYFQLGSYRRYLLPEPKKNQTADYNSQNEAYWLENFDAAAGAESANVKLESDADYSA